MITVPGFQSYTANLGVRDSTNDFLCITSSAPLTVEAVFTQSHFAGPSVVASRAHVGGGDIRALVAISKNANVGNGELGRTDMEAVLSAIAAELGCTSKQLLIASTGVIGRRYPIAKMLPRIAGFSARRVAADFEAAARAIMTTDTRPKFVQTTIGQATLVGIAKGVGMIEPNMATLFSFWFTDAQIDRAPLGAIFRRVMDKSFNCLSIDSDTSTSDTALVMANGLAGPIDLALFEAAFTEQAVALTQMVAADGEGATKIIEVNVHGADDDAAAKRIAKSIVNSPLVKTAIHGADPNWGRVLMAIGKVDSVDIRPDDVRVFFDDLRVYPSDASVDLFALTDLLRRPKVTINVELGPHTGQATVWGCDLSAEYVKINGSYST